MDRIINLGIPHISEIIFENIDTDELCQYFFVSQTWKVLAENVLLKRCKSKLFKACSSGKTKIVQLLLEQYESEVIGLNARNEYGMTPFICASQKGHKDVVQLLLDNSDIDLNARTDEGMTALTWACHDGHKDVDKLLLDHSGRIELNARNNFGMTALILANQRGHKDIAKMVKAKASQKYA